MTLPVRLDLDEFTELARSEVRRLRELENNPWTTGRISGIHLLISHLRQNVEVVEDDELVRTDSKAVQGAGKSARR